MACGRCTRGCWRTRRCTPARLAVADYMVEREDFEGALQLLRAPQADDADGKLGLAVAGLQFARGDPAAARATLEAVLLRQPRFLEAWLMLGEVCDVLGDTHAALRARNRLFVEANAQGRWISPETTEPQWRPAVRRNIEAYRRDKRERLFAAFAEVRERHGADSLRRFERALTGYLREWDATPPDARQRPKFFWFPDLPPGPYRIKVVVRAGRGAVLTDRFDVPKPEPGREGEPIDLGTFRPVPKRPPPTGDEIEPRLGAGGA